ncbi:MAG TPA: hypothetical protein VM223_26945 [Planctomycetota bacterium]|nr:hypothetical protein [Planctomycetota bacterium]
MTYTDDEKMLIAKWLFDESGETILDDFPRGLQDKLYEQYYQEMPYGTAKARTGTPDEWYEDNISQLQMDFAELEGLLEPKP